MRTLNTIRGEHFIIVILLLVTSCSIQDDIVIDPEVSSVAVEFENAIDKYQLEYDEIKPFLSDFYLENKGPISLKKHLYLTRTLSPLINPTLNLFEKAGFSKIEINELVGSNKDVLRTVFLGIVFFEFSKESLKNIAENFNGKNIDHGQYSRYESPIVVCFLEATGIAAGIGLVGALSGQAGGKALRAAFMKFIKKAGVKFVSGLGLVLMAGEFIWCLSTFEDISYENQEVYF